MDDKKFWQNVNVTDNQEDCWEWQKGKYGNGYGQVNINGIKWYSHRFVFWITFGYLPELPRQVNHHCDNRCCCNPNHLYDGTPLDNTRDMLNRGRNRCGSATGSENRMAKLIERDIPKIRRMIVCGYTLEYIGNVFGVTDDTICMINTGKTWTHVPRTPIKRYPRKE